MNRLRTLVRRSLNQLRGSYTEVPLSYASESNATICHLPVEAIVEVPPLHASESDATICNLPVEVIVTIARSMDPLSRILFSLSSKRLRTILTEYCDLPISDKKQKVDFLRILEVDLPELLTCCECARMFKWKAQKARHYQCPGSFKVPASKHSDCPRSVCYEYSHDSTKLSKEAIHLVLRAWILGPKFGLSPSSLDHSCTQIKKYLRPELQLCQRLEGRIVDGRFMLARSYILTGETTDSKISSLSDISIFICGYHDLWSAYRRIFDEKESLTYRESWALTTIKCSDCNTDMKIKFVRMPGEKLRVEVNVWQDLGSCSRREKSLQTTVDYHITDLPVRDPTLRDLERDYTTGCGMKSLAGWE